VPVVAGESLEALVRVAESAEVERTLTTSSDAAYPPRSGSQVGTLRLALGGETLGRIPVLAADLPAPHEPGGSWWGRTAGALAGAVRSVVAGFLG
jgi:hypothetical protein